ncbi:hypothetical protein GQ457_01G021370 [Hibiscus cannabinus]
MLATMNHELHKQHKYMVGYENLKGIYEGQARQERYETSKALFQCKNERMISSGIPCHQDDGLYPNVGKFGISS